MKSRSIQAVVTAGLLLAVCGQLSAKAQDAAPLVVKTGAGAVKGAVQNDILSFKGVPYAAVVPLTLPLSHELTGSLRTMKRVGATGVASEHLAHLVSNSGVAAKTLTAAQKKFKTKHPYREVVFPRSAWAGSEKYEVLARRDKR